MKTVKTVNKKIDSKTNLTIDHADLVSASFNNLILRNKLACRLDS
jgi:hypothetical protein